jgi:hypothetical protein
MINGSWVQYPWYKTIINKIFYTHSGSNRKPSDYEASNLPRCYLDHLSTWQYESFPSPCYRSESRNQDLSPKYNSELDEKLIGILLTNNWYPYKTVLMSNHIENF